MLCAPMNRRAINQLLKDGHSRKDIFEKAIETGLDPKKAAKFLASSPSLEAMNKHRGHRYAITGVAATAFLINLPLLIALMSQLPPVAMLVVSLLLLIPIYTVYALFTAKLEGFFLFWMLNANGIIDSLQSYSTNEVPAWAVTTVLTFSLAVMVYSGFVKMKMYPHQNLLNLRKDENGLMEIGA